MVQAHCVTLHMRAHTHNHDDFHAQPSTTYHITPNVITHAYVIQNIPIEQELWKVKFGHDQPFPKIAARLYSISKVLLSNRLKWSVDEPVTHACKRIQLPPGSKLKLNFPHLVKGVESFIEVSPGLATPGTANVGSGSYGLQGNV